MDESYQIMMSEESNRIVSSAESKIAFAPTLPTQFYTLHECRNLFKLNLALLVGAIALGIVTVSGAAAIGVLNSGLALFQFKKMERAIRAGTRFPKPAPRVPKGYELWIWPPLVALMTVGVIWLAKKFILQWLLHPANAPLMFACSLLALLYLSASWFYILWTGRREYRLYFAAKRVATSDLVGVTLKEVSDFGVSADKEKTEMPAQKPHWWTDTQSREEAKVTARR